MAGNFCPHCGTALPSPDAKFCSSCGASTSSPTGAPAVPPPLLSPPARALVGGTVSSVVLCIYGTLAVLIWLVIATVVAAAVYYALDFATVNDPLSTILSCVAFGIVFIPGIIASFRTAFNSAR